MYFGYGIIDGVVGDYVFFVFFYIVDEVMLKRVCEVLREVISV